MEMWKYGNGGNTNVPDPYRYIYRAIFTFSHFHIPLSGFFHISLHMRPDYPHKLFNDHRTNFNLLMETLAMDN